MKGVCIDAAWVLACWGEPVARDLLISGRQRRWIVEAFPSNWSTLFPLEGALDCIGSSYYDRVTYNSYGRTQAKIAAHLQWLAAGVDPAVLIDFLRRNTSSEGEYGAWKLLQARNIAPPLEILRHLLLRYDDVSWEVALEVGKQGMTSAVDVLNEMWALADSWFHVALTIALDDLKIHDAVRLLFSSLQGKASEAKTALWGLRVLGERDRAMRLETLRQMLQRPEADVRAAAICTLSSLNDISLAEALDAVNETNVELITAGCQAFPRLARAGVELPVNLLARLFIQLNVQLSSYHGMYINQLLWEGTQALEETFDELQIDNLSDTLVEGLGGSRQLVEPWIMTYLQKHAPRVFAEVIAQATTFLHAYL